jgi:hypothetical protein
MRRIAAFTLIMAHSFACAGTVVDAGTHWRFEESFSFQGNHAATIANGAASTVWWNESSWDARGDSSYTAVMPFNDLINNRFHIDVHKALNTNPTDARLSNTVLAAGGDGSAGVGIMHLDFQDIISARLRNPMKIGSAQTAEVKFYAPIFNTTAHWWEVAITPSNQVVGAEHTSVPGQNEFALTGPVVGSSGQPGPGHGPASDSINIVSFGASDVPCDTGWQVRFGATKTVAGVRSEAVNQVASLSQLIPTDTTQQNRLIHWRIRYLPNSIELAADPEEDGTFAVIDNFAMSVPWTEVYVHFMAVAYQADHHPQGACYLGHIREIAWRNITVEPVRFAATDVFPKNANTNQSPTAAWRGYDLRDMQRFGASLSSFPQPNATTYTVENSGRYCNDAGYPCFRNDAAATLNVTIPAKAGLQAARGQFVFDARDRDGSSSTATLRHNSAAAITLPGHDSVPAAEWQAWARRSANLNTAALAPGAHQFVLALQSGSYLDRMEVEIGYERVNEGFKDGFENQLAQTNAVVALAALPNSADSKTLNGSNWPLAISSNKKDAPIKFKSHCEH